MGSKCTNWLRRLRMAALAALLGVLAAGCSGSREHRPTIPADSSVAQNLAAPTHSLLLTHETRLQNGESIVAVKLCAHAVFDLYQIAGTLRYAPQQLELIGVSQGSFLGDPPDVIFFARADEPGKVPFALTKRAVSPGAIGSGVILQAEFRLAAAQAREPVVWLEDELLARDSLRHPVTLDIKGETGQ